MHFAHPEDRERVVRAAQAPVGRAGAAPAHILVVDDDQSASSALAKLLRADGFSTSVAADGEIALAETTRSLPDVVLTDLRMPRLHGIDLCKRIHAIDPELPVIVMTAFSDREAVIDALRAGAEDYLIKPLQYDAVLWCVERAIARRTAKREHEEFHRILNERLVLSSIREQEHAEAEARQRAQLNTLLENLSEGVTIADASGRILLLNGPARAILGVGDQDLPTIAEFNTLDARDLGGQRLLTEQRPLMRALRGERFTDYEVVHVRPNGERRRVLSTGTDVRNENGEVALGIVVSRDITELRRAEQRRDEYLALISHDLRTPLNCILLFVTALKRSMANKGLAEDLSLAERARENVARMNSMIEELTEAARIESQGVELGRDACDLHEIVASVAHRMDDERARRITLETKDASPYVVRANASSVERVVTNLLTNALKYSAEDAPVIVRLGHEGGDVELEVIDRGIGIPPESAKMIFTRYYRTEGSLARAKGLGLGLYIARLIVEAHGGRIEVSSEIGKGSTFRLFLPSQTGPRDASSNDGRRASNTGPSDVR